MRRLPFTGVAASGVVNFAGSVLGVVLGFVLVAIVGRALGTSATGVFFQVIAWYTIAWTLLRLGADTGLLRFWAIQSQRADVAALRRTLRTALVPTLLVSVAVAVGVTWAAPSLGAAVHAGVGTQGMTTTIRVLAWCLPTATVTSALLGGLRGLGSVVAFTLLQNVLVPALRVVLALIVLAGGSHRVASVLTAWALPLPLVLVISGGLVWRTLTGPGPSPGAVTSAPASGGDPAAPRRFWRFSLARGLAAALEVVLDWLDVLLVAALRSASEAGVYAVVTRLARAGLIVDSAARVAVAPRMASLLDRGEHQRAGDLFAGLAGLAMFVSWPAYLTVIAYAPTVLAWFGPDFSTGQTALRIVSAAMMVVLSAGIVQTMLLMGGRSHYQLANKAVALVVNLVANLLLIPRMGISGAALAWLVTLLVDTAMASWQVRHGFQVSLRLRSLIPVGGVALTAGAGALALARLWGQGTAALAVTTVVVAAGYLALSWRLRDRLGWRELRML